jgi:hypothetical protein
MSNLEASHSIEKEGENSQARGGSIEILRGAIEAPIAFCRAIRQKKYKTRAHARLHVPSTFPPFPSFLFLTPWLPPASLVSLALVCPVLDLHTRPDFQTSFASGANREVKKAVEAYWAGKLSAQELENAAADVRKTSLKSIKEKGVDLIPR